MKFFDRREAAVYLQERGLRYTSNTLQKFATVGGGPSYRRFGNRAVYTRLDLDSWIEAKLSAPKGGLK